MIVNKLILYIFLLTLPFTVTANPVIQDSVPKTELINFLATDTVYYKQRGFEQGYKENYRDSDFVYETKSKESNSWDRFLEWLSRLIRSIFSFGEKSQTATSIIVKIVVYAIILLVIYFIVKTLLGKEVFFQYSFSVML